MPDLNVEATAAEDATLLTVSGELDITAKEPLDEAVDAALLAGSTALIVDLTPTTFVDSTGLSYLLQARRRADAAQAQLRVRAPSGTEARLVIDLAGLGSLLAVEDAR